MAGEAARKDITIRRIQEGDTRLFQEFFGGLSEKTLYFFTPHNLDKGYLADMVENISKDKDSIRFMACTGEGAEEKMVGYVFYFDWSKKVPTLGIGIRDDFQGMGLGAVLMEHIIHVAKEHGKSAVLLKTKQDNFRAQSLYKKFGFQFLGIDHGGEFIMLLNFADDFAGKA